MTYTLDEYLDDVELWLIHFADKALCEVRYDGFERDYKDFITAKASAERALRFEGIKV